MYIFFCSFFSFWFVNRLWLVKKNMSKRFYNTDLYVSLLIQFQPNSLLVHNVTISGLLGVFVFLSWLKCRLVDSELYVKEYYYYHAIPTLLLSYNVAGLRWSYFLLVKLSTPIHLRNYNLAIIQGRLVSYSY